MSVPVSLAQEAVEKAAKELFGGKNPPLMEKLIYPSGKDAALEILSRFYVSAQLAALESVAKEGCRQCAGNPPTAGPAEYDGEYWIHVYPGGSWGSCDRPEAWDAISRLRGTGGQS